MKTLIQENEIGKASVYGHKIASCSVSDIGLVEFQIEECFGTPFMDFLKGSLVDYSNCKSWTRDEEFKEGDIVAIHGTYWIATKDSQGKEPKTDGGKDCWVTGEKFKKPCLNELWCDGSLFTYMDLMIQVQVAPELSMPLGQNGWRKNTGDKSESLSPKEIGIRLQMIKEKAGIALQKLDKWIRAKCDEEGYEGCFDLYKPLNRSCCSSCGCKTEKCSCNECIDNITGWNDFAFA